MRQVRVVILSMLMVPLCGLLDQGQQSMPTATNATVPPLIQFSNVATDEGGNSLSGVVNITFSLYNSQQGDEPLWTEVQNNVQLDSLGHYSVQLGITKPAGVPTTLFTTGEARWLGVQIADQPEQARVLLLSVPYALKAGDAATIGGLPPSAFVLAAPGTASITPTTLVGSGPSSADAPAGSDVTGSGTADFIPLWTTTSNVGNSVLFQSGSGTTAKIGVGTTTPASTLDIKGGSTVRGVLGLPATGNATATAGKNSQPLNLAASAFNSTSSTAVNQTFQWQAEPASNDTAAPSGTLNLLFGEGATKPSETGLNIASNGQITFATGQTFPTVTGNETVTGNISSDGSVSATTSFDIGGTPFAFGSNPNFSAFLGFAGNSTLTGRANTAVGYEALFSDTTGGSNVASGANALQNNTTGSYNVAVGQTALIKSTSGFANTGIGNAAGQTIDGSSLTGKNNTALGTGTGFTTGGLDNASALGANAVVGESNALVLGGINGVNGQTVSINVGIGTTTPRHALDVENPNVSIYGAVHGFSSEGGPFTGAGVWGDTGGTSGGFYSGVLGSADDNEAGTFDNNSSTDIATPALYIRNDSETYNALVLNAVGKGGGNCYMNVDGNFACTGPLKNVVPADGGARRVSVYAMQSAENWFEDAGSSRLSNGSATVALDPTFAQIVNTGVEYHVFLTPNGDCKGLYVSEKSATSFEVRELGGGRASIAFDYRIMAKRVRYENVRLADMTEQYQKMQEREQLRLEQIDKQRPARSAAARVSAVATPTSGIQVTHPLK